MIDEHIREELDLKLWELHPEENIPIGRYIAARDEIINFVTDNFEITREFLEERDRCELYWFLSGLAH